MRFSVQRCVTFFYFTLLFTDMEPPVLIRGTTSEFGRGASENGGVPLLNCAMPKPECQRVAGSEGTYKLSLVSLSFPLQHPGAG